MSANVATAFLAMPYDVQLNILDSMLDAGMTKEAFVVAECAGLGQDLQNHLLVGSMWIRDDAIILLGVVQVLDLVKRHHGDNGLRRVFGRAMDLGATKFLHAAIEWVPQGLEFKAPADADAAIDTIKWAKLAGVNVVFDNLVETMVATNNVETLDVLQNWFPVVNYDDELDDYICNLVLEKLLDLKTPFPVFQWWVVNGDRDGLICEEDILRWWDCRMFDRVQVVLEHNGMIDKTCFVGRAVTLPDSSPIRRLIPGL